MEIVKDQILFQELQELAEKMFGDMIKAVIDIDKNVMAVDGELHADLEAELLELGSRQQNLWGINLYPANYGKDSFVEFDSLINIRPRQNNRTRSVEDPKLREKIIQLVGKLIIKPSPDELYDQILRKQTPLQRAKLFDGMFDYAKKVNPEAFKWPKPLKNR